MNAEWYILIDGKKEGPFSINQLKKDTKVTPDTLVWKNGFKEWLAIRQVPELADLFKDENVIPGKEENNQDDVSTDLVQQDQAALTLRHDPTQWVLWLLVLILLLVYILYQTR